MRYAVAVLVCSLEFFIYVLIGVAVGWRHGGGYICGGILLAIVAWTWRTIVQHNGTSSSAETVDPRKKEPITCSDKASGSAPAPMRSPPEVPAATWPLVVSIVFVVVLVYVFLLSLIVSDDEKKDIAAFTEGVTAPTEENSLSQPEAQIVIKEEVEVDDGSRKSAIQAEDSPAVEELPKYDDGDIAFTYPPDMHVETKVLNSGIRRIEVNSHRSWYVALGVAPRRLKPEAFLAAVTEGADETFARKGFVLSGDRQVEMEIAGKARVGNEFCFELEERRFCVRHFAFKLNKRTIVVSCGWEEIEERDALAATALILGTIG